MRVDELIFQERDVSVHRARGETFRVETEIADHVTGEADGVGLVVNGEVARVADPVTVSAQNSHTCGVEGTHPHRFDHGPNQPSDAFAHLARCLVSEGDGEDRRGMHAGSHEVSDAMGEHPRLARTGASHHQQRTAGVDDGVVLIGVEALEQCVDGRVRDRQRELPGIRHGPSILRRGCHPRGPVPADDQRITATGQWA